MLLLLLAALPTLVWDGDPSTAATLKQHNLTQIAVKAPEEWRGAPVQAKALPQQSTALPLPGIKSRVGVGGATSAPWLEANGWRMERRPQQPYLYDQVPGDKLALALAEAYIYGGESVFVRPAAVKDLPIVAQTVQFLQGLDSAALPVVSNIALVDDGTPEVGEVLNLLNRRNLLAKLVQEPAPPAQLTIKLDSPQYPRKSAMNPSEFALKVRYQLGDDHRMLRLYGSEVVLARLTGDGPRMRLHLLNYSPRPVEGLRVRVLGKLQPQKVAALAQPDLALTDVEPAPDALEFTLPKLGTYAVVDLAVIH